MSISTRETRPYRAITVRTSYLLLGAMFCLAVCIRTALSFRYSNNPSIMPDESLYLNLARSLWNHGDITLRGQGLTYDHLFYPLLLSPLYALSDQLDMLRVIQVVNALLICSSALPAFLLARRMAGVTQGLLVAALTLLMPDMAIAQIIMSDSLCYPFTLWTFWAAHRALNADGPVRDALPLGLFASLLFLTKPGYAAIGIVTALALGLSFIKGRNKSMLIKAILLVAIMLASAVALRLIGQHVLGLRYDTPSIYETQLSGFSLSRVLQSLNGILLYLYFFPLALCIFPLALPLAKLRTLAPIDRRFALMLAASSLAIIVGTAYIIYINEYTGAPFGARVHLRYLAAFAPAFFALSLSPALRNQKMNTALLIFLAWVLSATLVFTPSALLSNRSYPVDALMLSALTNDTGLTNPKTLVALVTLLLLLLGGYQLWCKGWTAGIQRALFICIALLSLVHNLSAYDLMRHHHDAAWAADANEAARATRGRPTLFIAEDGGYFWNPASAFDTRSRDVTAVVELDDILRNTEAGGYFSPFIPRPYWTTAPDKPIEQPELMVMNNVLLHHLVLAEGLSATATANGRYAILSVQGDAPWIHSALSGFSSGKTTDHSGLYIFSPDLCKQSTLHVQLNLSPLRSGARLMASYGDQQHTLDVSQANQWIDLTFNLPGDGQAIFIALSSPDGEQAIAVHTYLLSGE